MTCLAYRSGGERILSRCLTSTTDGWTNTQTECVPTLLNLLANGLPDVINIIK